MVSKYNFTIILTVWFLTSFAIAKDVKKSKVEELFLWKMSDELSLSPTEEKKLNDLISDLNQKKFQCAEDMEKTLAAMAVAKTKTAKIQEWNKYKKSLHGYNQLAEQEMDDIKKMLGLERAIKYLSVKQDITNRLKSVLSNPDSSPKKDLPAPKIIEE